jgi:hypothetical protein
VKLALVPVGDAQFLRLLFFFPGQNHGVFHSSNILLYFMRKKYNSYEAKEKRDDKEYSLCNNIAGSRSRGF